MGRHLAIWIGPSNALSAQAPAGRQDALSAADVASLLARGSGVLRVILACVVRDAQWENARNEYVRSMDCHNRARRHSMADRRWSAAKGTGANQSPNTA